MEPNYLSYAHAKWANFWHLEWCTKYRYKCMRKTENQNMVNAAIRKAACEAGIQIRQLEVMSDHIHVLVMFPRGMTDSEALRRLKGRSAYLIFRHKPKFRLRYPKGYFWSRGSFATTVGFTDYKTIDNYLLNKKHITAQIKRKPPALAGGGCHPELPMDNHEAERSLSSLVVMRKIIGCLRSELGVKAHETIMSLISTWEKQQKNVFYTLQNTL